MKKYVEVEWEDNDDGHSLLAIPRINMAGEKCSINYTVWWNDHYKVWRSSRNGASFPGHAKTKEEFQGWVERQLGITTHEEAENATLRKALEPIIKEATRGTGRAGCLLCEHNTIEEDGILICTSKHSGGVPECIEMLIQQIIDKAKKE